MRNFILIFALLSTSLFANAQKATHSNFSDLVIDEPVFTQTERFDPIASAEASFAKLTNLTSLSISQSSNTKLILINHYETYFSWKTSGINPVELEILKSTLEEHTSDAIRQTSASLGGSAIIVSNAQLSSIYE